MDTSIEMLGRLTGLPLVLGIKPYATFLVFGLMLKLGYITDPFFLQPQFHFSQNNLFLAIVSLLFVIETLADKIPFVDHVSDLIHTILKPLAGAFLGFLVVNAVDVNQTFGLVSLSVAIMGGGAISLTTHATKSIIRLASTKFTAGIGNSILSGVEDVIAIGGTVAIVKYPFFMGIVFVIFALIFIILAPKLLRLVMTLFQKIYEFLGYWLGINRKPTI
jgi:hypothetical protein